jgi:hypothetical protein
MINSTVKYVGHFRSFMYLSELQSCVIRGTTATVPEVQSLTSVAAQLWIGKDHKEVLADGHETMNTFSCFVG